MKVAIIYHINCNDGICSAAIVRKAVQHRHASETYDPKNIEYFPCNYGYDFPELDPKTRQVFIVDFSFPPQVMREAAVKYPSAMFTVIDHHQSAIEKYTEQLVENPMNLELSSTPKTVNDIVPSNVELVFDTGYGMAGANMCWKYFFPGEVEPELVADVSDRDTWNFDRSSSKPMHSALLALGDKRNPEYFQKIIEDQDLYADLYEKGKLLEANNNSVLEELSQQVIYRKYENFAGFENIRLCLCNTPYRFLSDLSQYIVDNDPRWKPDMIFVGFNVRKHGKVSLSFRSKNKQAKKLAEHYGGGGHFDSAGAGSTYSNLLGLLIEGKSIPSKDLLPVEDVFVVQWDESVEEHVAYLNSIEGYTATVESKVPYELGSQHVELAVIHLVGKSEDFECICFAHFKLQGKLMQRNLTQVGMYRDDTEREFVEKALTSIPGWS